MANSKWNMNTIYISERLHENMRPVSCCAITSVVAPMGYGKTTAVTRFLAEKTKTENASVVRIIVYSDNLAVFWKNTQDSFARAGYDFLQGYPRPTDVAGAGLLADDICHELDGERPCYIFIDDFHLIKDKATAEFLCSLAVRLPENVHLIVVGRDSFIPADQILRLGSKLYKIGIDQLRLNHRELSAYARRCGIKLSDEQVDSVLYSTEGWFSAVYLNLLTYFERGTLPGGMSDIYDMITAAIISPLTKSQQEFISIMGLADEFSVRMAMFVTKNNDAQNIISMLTMKNAFVERLPDGVTYRFHHMMKECAYRAFLKLDKSKQTDCLDRYGMWYEQNGQVIHAMSSYLKSSDFDSFLRVVQNDAGIMLSSLSSSTILSAIDKCPIEIMKEHPLAILVLMRCMFNLRNIPKMLELKGVLMSSVESDAQTDETERNNILGECDLIMSFLYYNDISAMSRLHISASRRMNRTAISIRNNGGWTFGSPSVLMMFYRAPGELDSELAEMDACMPHYYKITDGHGQGAEKIMRSEALFMQGNFIDAHICLESAYSQIEGNGQENMAICCDFLAWRLSLCADIEARYTFSRRYEELAGHHNVSWINMWDATCAYYHSLIGKTDKIPEIYAMHNLGFINILAPGKPMIHMIENQVYLAQGAYAAVIGRSEKQLEECNNMHYALVALHIYIQTAAAYEMLGKREQALSLLEIAVDNAMPDGFVMPFVENYRYIKSLLSETERNEFTDKIILLGETRERRLNKDKRPSVFSLLTNREYEIVGLIGERLSNREIAQKLFLSEGSVKQYVKEIYSKLNIDGDTRTKRKRLAELIKINY